MELYDKLLRDANLSLKRSGIMTADRYFRSVETCFDGGVCPIKAFDLKSQDEWTTLLDESEGKLVYSNDEMDIKSHEKAKGGPVMQFDCIVTSTKRDRDRDILETKGASIDVKSPLLWQHIPMQPIGALVRTLGHTESQLTARFTIADTELGRDAATLIEAGALRISHGFEPTKFKPLKDEGWHIEEFEIFEVSVVSIPSNTDAVITQFSRSKLHNPLVRNWAKQMFDARPTSVSVGVDVAELDDESADEQPIKRMKTSTDGSVEIEYFEPCQCQKSAEEPKQLRSAAEADAKADDINIDTKSIPAGCWALPKSYEWVRESLSMELNEICCDVRGWAFVFATFKDFAVVAVEHNNGNCETFKADWAMKKGRPMWTSELTEVEIEVDAKVLAKARDAARAVANLPDALKESNPYAVAVSLLMGGDIEQVKSLHDIASGILAAHESKQRALQIEAENSAVLELLS